MSCAGRRGAGRAGGISAGEQHIASRAPRQWETKALGAEARSQTPATQRPAEGAHKGEA